MTAQNLVQVVIGVLLLWASIHLGTDPNGPRNNLAVVAFFLMGAFLLCMGAFGNKK